MTDMYDYDYNENSEMSNLERTNLSLEALLDKIAEALITSPYIDLTKVRANQKTIRNGLISLGRTYSDKLILFQKDIKANEEDLKLSTLDDGELYTLEGLASNITDTNSIEIVIDADTDGNVNSINLNHNNLDSESGIELIELLTEISDESGLINPLNISQFFNVSQEQTIVDPTQANEYLDTNIFELLPAGSTKQDEINQFYADLQNLLPRLLPSFDNNPEDGRVDRDENGEWIGSQQYYWDNSIASTQDDADNSTISEDDSYITRLSSEGDNSSQNSGKTIEDIYKLVVPYLTDVLEDPFSPEDERPEYENQSDGYLKFRNLNQGIIIRNTNKEFAEGLDPNNLTYLDTGFTISMWVRFLDKVSTGTLFNFGNPTRNDDTAFGFKLETYVLNKDDNNPHTNHETWGDGAAAIYNYEPSRKYFENSNTARFVRLVVNDNGVLRDSHIGVPGAVKFSDIPDNDGVGDDEFRLLQTTFIPEDFQEWYFINATFNHLIDEDNSFDLTGPDGEEFNEEPNFWLNHMNEDGTLTNSSNLGNRCKVEIISRTDLLRARGYKV